MQLAAEADVVVENFSPRVVEHFGLDYESLAQVNPDIIMVRMPGFGLVGPWRDYVGWALNFEQVSGMAAATGHPDGPPCDLQGPADPIAGVHATIALLSALDHRRRTGEGQLVEIAQIEACAAVAAQPVIEYSVTGVVPEREGNRHRVYAQGVYPAADDTWVALSVRDDADWAALVDVIGRPELLDDNRFGTAEQRLSNHDAFDDVLAEWTRTQSPEEIVDALSARGVPAERLMTAGRMYDVAQLDARGYYEELVHPLTGPHRFPGWPFRITPGPLRHHRTAPPTLGQHNAEVLTALGVSDQEIAALRESDVIGERLLNASRAAIVDLTSGRRGNATNRLFHHRRDGVDHACRPIGTLDLDRHTHGGAGAPVVALHLDQLCARPDPGIDGHRGGKAQLVHAVVHLHRQTGHLVDLLHQNGNQRQGEVAVGDRAAVGPGGRLLGVDVDPLVITRRVGEQIDLLLGDVVPVAVAEVLAELRLERRDPIVDRWVRLRACVIPRP